MAETKKDETPTMKQWAEAVREDPDRWPRFADGYQACPACGALVHPSYNKIHANACAEIRRMENEAP